MIGVKVEGRMTYMGHASIGIKLDRDGHLMLGNAADAAGILDNLDRSVTDTGARKDPPVRRCGGLQAASPRSLTDQRGLARSCSPPRGTRRDLGSLSAAEREAATAWYEQLRAEY